MNPVLILQLRGAMLLAYMRGKAPGGGLTLSGTQPGVSGDCWVWGCLPDQTPNGCVASDGKMRPEQAPFIAQMLFHPSGK